MSIIISHYEAIKLVCTVGLLYIHPDVLSELEVSAYFLTLSNSDSPNNKVTFYF